MYLGLISAGILGMWIFANKQVQALYLLRDTKKIGIMTYTNFGMTYNRMQEVPIDQIKGTRLFWSQSMNIYQLEYRFLGKYTGLTKGRSFFYRPQHITNIELWNEIKRGKEILTMADIKSA